MLLLSEINGTRTTLTNTNSHGNIAFFP